MCLIDTILISSISSGSVICSKPGGWGIALLSGFAGAIIAQVISLWYQSHRQKQEYRGLLRGIVAECKYCERVAKEVVAGTLSGGSFKRLPIDYFRGIREISVKYEMSKELVDGLVAACTDLNLLNLEADYVFDGKVASRIQRNLLGQDISMTILSAQDGVLGTLGRLKRAALRELNIEEDDDEDQD